MKKLFLFTLILFAVVIQPSFGQVPDYTNLVNSVRPPLFGASPFQDSLWAFDTTNFQVIYRVAPTPSSGGSITGINSMSMHPCTGEIYVVCKQSAVSGRVLGIYNIRTAVVTIIGNLGDNFSSISFREDGQLFGVTGDGATVPETMYLIDHTNATKTVARTLGNGADGEVICHNPDDNSFYHWSGNGTVVFEKIGDIAPYTITGIPIIGATNGETFGANYLGGGRFLISNISSRFQKITTTGTWGAQYGNTTPDDIRGHVIPKRWIAALGNDTVCANDSSLFVASGGTAYQWVRNGVDIPGAVNDSLYADLTGWYNCRITIDTCADTALVTHFLKVNNVPVVGINPSPNAYFCAPGDSVLLTGSAGGTSQWYANGAPIVGATATSLWVSVAGSYNMMKTNLNNCSDTAAVPTVVSLPPALTINPTGTVTICQDSAAITLSANSDATAYQWLENNNALSGETNDTLITNLAGSYSVIVTYGLCIDTTAMTQLVQAPPITISPAVGDTICENSTVLLSTNTNADAYQWMEGANTLTGETNDTLITSQPGMYYVIVTYGACVDTSANSILSLAPVAQITPTGSSTICIPGTVTLVASSNGTAYAWLKDGAIISGQTNDTLVISQTGTYAAVVTFGDCTDTSSVTYSLTAIDCSSIDESEGGISLLVFPNPAKEQVTIQTELKDNWTVDITDMNGRVLRSYQPSQPTFQPDLSGMEKGIYLVRVRTAAGHTAVTPLVVQ